MAKNSIYLSVAQRNEVKVNAVKFMRALGFPNAKVNGAFFQSSMPFIELFIEGAAPKAVMEKFRSTFTVRSRDEDSYSEYATDTDPKMAYYSELDNGDQSFEAEPYDENCTDTYVRISQRYY